MLTSTVALAEMSQVADQGCWTTVGFAADATSTTVSAASYAAHVRTSGASPRQLRHRKQQTPKMRYRVLMSVIVDAADDNQAYAQAEKLGELLKSPLVRMTVSGSGVALSGDGDPVAYVPQREHIDI